MRARYRRRIPGRSIGMLIIVGVLGLALCSLSGCAPVYGYPDYPSYGYAPYSWGWGNTWGYDPTFVVHHPWEEHYGVGHHTEFYHTEVGHVGGGGFHGGGGEPHGGGFHGGGEPHGGGGHR
jgi:hypothetical protein